MVKRALYVAIHCWTSPIQTGSHAIASKLVEKGWEVAYISAPITPLNFLRPNSSQFATRLREYRMGGQRAMGGKLWHFVPFSLLAPSNRSLMNSLWLSKYWHYLSVPNLLSIVQSQGFGTVDLLFLDSIYQPFWLNALNYKTCVARLSDYYAGFQGYGKGTKESEKQIVSQADLVITASHQLANSVVAQGAKQSLYIPNGVDLSRFTASTLMPNEYRTLQGPVAVFVGDINLWVDLDLISSCAQALPLVNFVLIGPYAKHLSIGNLPKNVHFLGLRPHWEIPAYLQYAQLGLIPFDMNRCKSLVEHINPLKLYEYMASGLPVVSTCWPEMERLKSPAVLCTSTSDFIAAVQDALHEPKPSDKYMQYAHSVSWEQRLVPFFEWLP